MRIRVRGPEGVSTITLADTSSIADLRRGISSSSGVVSFTLKRGYPPVSLDLDHYANETMIQDTGLQLNGEQLIVVSKDEVIATHERSSVPGKHLQPVKTTAGNHGNTTQASAISSTTPKATNSAAKIEDDAPEILMPSKDATMMLRVMPSDNSCLFRAFSYLIFGPGIDSMHELRSLVASTIQSDPETYSDAVLGKPREDYCKWIQTEYSWGGYVELIILAQHFQIGVASINVQDGRVDYYNEDASSRCILVYSGIHYDAIAISPNNASMYGGKAAPDEDAKAFDSSDDEILSAALDLCKELRKRNYHVDVSQMGSQVLKCLVCGWTGNGMDEVSKHVSETGHTNMSQT